MSDAPASKPARGLPARLRTAVFNVLFYAQTLFLAGLSVPVSLVGGNGPVRWLFGRWCAVTLWLVRHVLGARVEIRGLEHVRRREPPPPSSSASIRANWTSH